MEANKLYELYLQHPVITTDTRDCPAGSIFIALKGASFDGNAFAVKALEAGCAYAIIDNADYATDERCILVEDSLQAFKDIAREHRRRFTKPVIGITGTNGKTTTKELVSAVLSEKYNVLYTQGNFNNDVGVPKTLMRLRPEHDIAVVEMGANHPGDIKTLVETVEPDCGLITNVGRAHLQGFGSFEGVKNTKGELYDFLVANGKKVFIDTDSTDLLEMANNRGINDAIGYGQIASGNALVIGEVIACDPFLRFRWRRNTNDAQWHEVSTQLIGSYNITNMLAAATVGLTYGITEEQICNALANYTPSNNRSQLTVTQYNHLVVDAYNANPTSMAAALRNFEAMQVDNKMMILGSMGELGDVSLDEHIKIVEAIKASGINEVWLVGDEFAKTTHPFRQFTNVEAVKEAIAEEKPTGKYILIKGSNSQKLFQLPELL